MSKMRMKKEDDGGGGRVEGYKQKKSLRGETSPCLFMSILHFVAQLMPW